MLTHQYMFPSHNLVFKKMKDILEIIVRIKKVIAK